MNTKNSTYGSIVKQKNDKYHVFGWNPMEQAQVLLGTGLPEKEAQKILNDWNFDFFEKNTWMLPKSISINRTRKKYVFQIGIRNKPIYVSQHDNLNEAVEARNKFITSLF